MFLNVISLEYCGSEFLDSACYHNQGLNGTLMLTGCSRFQMIKASSPLLLDGLLVLQYTIFDWREIVEGWRVTSSHGFMLLTMSDRF